GWIRPGSRVVYRLTSPEPAAAVSALATGVVAAPSWVAGAGCWPHAASSSAAQAAENIAPGRRAPVARTAEFIMRFPRVLGFGSGCGPARDGLSKMGIIIIYAGNSSIASP